MNVTLVVPTIRPGLCESFLSQWQSSGCACWNNVIVVYDGEESPVKGWHDYRSIKDHAQDDHWIFSRKDSAIRSFGFWLAWKQGADIVVTLDDDCLPIEPLQKHVDILSQERRTVINTAGKVPARGIPNAHSNRACSPPKISMGLWSGTPDVYGHTQLAYESLPQLIPNGQSHLVGRNEYVPLCGMNLAFSRDVIPLMYFPLMGEGTPFARFDDIWCGWVAQRICQHLGFDISWGSPYVYHSRASNAHINANKERPGVPYNDILFTILDDMDFHGNSAQDCLSEVAGMLTGLSCAGNIGYTPYWEKLSKAYTIWKGLFSL